MKQIILFLLLSHSFTAWAQSQSKYLEVGETLKIEEEVIEFDTLLMPNETVLWITSPTASLTVQHLIVGESCKIMANGREGKNGINGRKGSDGEDGEAGQHGKNLTLDLNILSLGSLEINVDGGDGGDGGAGSQGSLKVNECNKNILGSDGGDGGNAGKGGNGGKVKIKLSEEQAARFKDKISISALPGKAGTAGMLGAKGETKIICNCHNGGNIKPGKDGTDGRPSVDGKAGSVKW